MKGVLLRRVVLFAAVAGLGGVLAALLTGERGGRHPGARPKLPVVDIPAGTEIRSGGVSGVTVVSAEGIVISDVRDVRLEDGSTVPFRAMVLRADSERPLPSPAPGVRSLALEGPDLQIAAEPRTRGDLTASEREPPLHLAAPRGVLHLGPGEEMRLRLEGGVSVAMVKDGVPWTFAGETVDADLRSRRITAPGVVRVASADIEAEGRDLETEDGGGRLLLSGGAAGKVHRAGGARLGGAGTGGSLDFSCRGPFLIEKLAAPPAYADPGAAADLAWYRISLSGDAALVQADGRLAAPRIEVDLRRGSAAAPSARDDLPVTELRARGGSVLDGGGTERPWEARARDLTARPGRAGSTEVLLDGEPVLLMAERDGEIRRTLRVSSLGPASVVFPKEEGDVSALFRGSAAAALLEEAEGVPPLRRDLRARMLRVQAHRPAGGGPAVLREVVADGEAELREGERSARARLVSWTPGEDGGSVVTLRETVSVHWPAAGLLDPVTAAAGGSPGAPRGGSLLLSTPREAVLRLPPAGATDRGARVSVSGGAVLRRIVGEQEVYRLTCGRIEALMHPANAGIARIEALKDVRFEGREENQGARRYDLRGSRLLVTGDAGAKEPRGALLEGTAPGPRAEASFRGEDGRPFTLTADSISFDRSTGGFRATGDVRAEGILPERPGPVAGGRGSLACPVLTGRLDAGAAGASRLAVLDAEGPVHVKTESAFASGESLRWNAAGGALVLEGAPARVAARSGAAALGLEDLCEAPILRLTLDSGNLVEARAEKGGRLLRHVPPGGEEPGKARGPERIEARCTGLLLHTPGETRMQEDVTLVRSSLGASGDFEEKERLSGADALRVLHPVEAGPGGQRKGAGGFASAEALSRAGTLTIATADGKLSADGVSRLLVDAATSTVVLDASMDRPRFSLTDRGRTAQMRRAVYDYAQGIVTEQVGATTGDGR